MQPPITSEGINQRKTAASLGLLFSIISIDVIHLV